MTNSQLIKHIKGKHTEKENIENMKVEPASVFHVAQEKNPPDQYKVFDNLNRLPLKVNNSEKTWQTNRFSNKGLSYKCNNCHKLFKIYMTKQDMLLITIENLKI